MNTSLKYYDNFLTESTNNLAKVSMKLVPLLLISY